MTEADEALQRAIADASLDRAAGEEMRDDLEGFLRRRGVAAADVEAILRAPRRLAVYRSLVRNGLSSVVLEMLPKTRAHLNGATSRRGAPGRFDADLAAFVEQQGPRTHYLRDVPFEFVAWASPGWRGDAGVPAYVGDLAAHELAHFEVASAVDAAAGDIGEVELGRAVVLAGAPRIVRHAFAVHEITGDGPLEPPSAREVRLLAYRDAAHRVQWLELTPLAAAILERLVAGQALGVAVEGACADGGSPAPASVGPEVARLLADLGERGVLLGGRLPG